MIAIVALAMLRQRLTSPLRLVILGMVFASSWIAGAFMKSLAPLEGAAGMFALTLAAGAIGQEVASGTLTLTFARPLTRASYVFGRWAGATLFAAALAAVLEALTLLSVAARGGPLPGGGEMAALALEGLLNAGAMAAVMVMLSSFVNGLGDVALWVMGAMGSSAAQMLGNVRQWPWLVRAGAELDATLNPKVHLGWLFGTGDPQGYLLVVSLSTTAAALAVAVWVVNRKELSYAAG